MYGQSQAASAQKKAAAPLNAAQGTLYTKAEQIADTPYVGYTGQQVADLSGNQQQAYQLAGENAGNNNQAKDYLTSAGDMAGKIAGNNWDADTAAKYMNPYTQDVTNIALRQEKQSYADSLNQSGLNAAGVGAFGGDRAALQQATLTGQHNLNQGDIEAQGMAAAYTNAQQTWQADNQRMASAASAYANAGNDVTAMNAQQLKDLLATGGAAQAVQQMKLTTGYNNYLDQRNWATNQLAPLESAVGRTPTLAAPSPVNYASDALGSAAALAGYYGSTYQAPVNAPISNSDATGAVNISDAQLSDQLAQQSGNYSGWESSVPSMSGDAAMAAEVGG